MLQKLQAICKIKINKVCVKKRLNLIEWWSGLLEMNSILLKSGELPELARHKVTQMFCLFMIWVEVSGKPLTRSMIFNTSSSVNHTCYFNMVLTILLPPVCLTLFFILDSISRVVALVCVYRSLSHTQQTPIHMPNFTFIYRVSFASFQVRAMPNFATKTLNSFFHHA